MSAWLKDVNGIEVLTTTSNANPLPVSIGSFPIATGAATSAKQDVGNGSLSSIDTKTPALVGGKVPVDTGLVQGLTDTQLRATALPVSGTFWQATQPVSFTRLSSGTDSVTTVPSGTQTVSGTVTANAGTGNFNTKPDGTVWTLTGTSANVNVTNTVNAAQSGTWNITNISGTVSLPTGAATSASQTTGNNSLSSIDGKITACNTGAVVVSSSALPTGASTAANQTTANNSLSSIDGKMATLGQKTMANSQPVVISSDQSILTTRMASSATAAALGLFPTVTGYGVLRVSPESSSMFFDTFDTDDTTNNWTLKTSTGTSSITTGTLTNASTTTASAYGGRFSIPLFKPRGINFLGFGASIRFANSTIANTLRWIGIGTLPTTPTTTAPVTDGVGFILDGSGSFFGVVYAAGTQIASVNLTAYKFTDNTFGRVGFSYRSDVILFYVGTTEYPVGSLSGFNPSIQTLPISSIAIAASSAPASSATMDIVNIGLGDTGRNQQGICDTDFPSRTATVKLASTAALATDKPLVVAVHPSSPMYQRTVDQCVTTVGTSGAALTATLAAAGAGLKHYITKIEITAFAAAARTASATPVTVTTTNIVNTPSFTFKANAMPQGDTEIQDKNFVLPLSTTTANTATTVVCPATTSVIWRINVFYYIAA